MDILKRNKILIWVGALLLMSNLALVTSIIIKNKSIIERPFQREYWKNHRNKQRGDFLANQLHLSGDQLKKYNTAKDIHKDNQQQLRNQILDYKRQIHQELFKNNPDTQHINELADSIGHLNAAFEKSNYSFFLDIKQLLTSTQADRLQEIMNHRNFTGHPQKGQQHHQKKCN